MMASVTEPTPTATSTLDPSGVRLNETSLAVTVSAVPTSMSTSPACSARALVWRSSLPEKLSTVVLNSLVPPPKTWTEVALIPIVP